MTNDALTKEDICISEEVFLALNAYNCIYKKYPNYDWVKHYKVASAVKMQREKFDLIINEIISKYPKQNTIILFDILSRINKTQDECFPAFKEGDE